MGWYCRMFDQEFGPFELDELSEMVRQGTLTAADLVRADDCLDWQPAERDAVLGEQFLQNKRASSLSVEDRVQESQAAAQVAVSQPSPVSREWRTAVQEALQQRRKAGEKVEQEDVGSQGGLVSTWLRAAWWYPLWGLIAGATLVLQALFWLVCVTVGQLALVKQVGLLLAWMIGGTLAVIEESKEHVRKVIVIFMTMAAMGICGYSLWSWTAREQLRFPSRRQEVAPLMFPFVGPCEPTEYWFWLINAVTVAGVVTCLFSIWLVKQAR